MLLLRLIKNVLVQGARKPSAKGVPQGTSLTKDEVNAADGRFSSAV